MRLMKLCSVVVGVVGFLGSAVAMAQDAAAGAPHAATPPPAGAPSSETPVAAASAPMTPMTKSTIGADGAFVLPLGNFSDAVGLGFGALLRYEYNVIPQLNLTGRVGFLYHLNKDIAGSTSKFWNIPVLVGAKYDIASGFYGAAEAGIFYNHATVDVSIPGLGTMSVSNSETDFGINIGAGYKMGDLDIRAGFQIANLSHAGDSEAIVANVGYNFAKM